LVECKVSDVGETQRNRSNGGIVVMMEMDVVSKDGDKVCVVLKNANYGKFSAQR